jgi:hypothetical protein
MIGGYVNLPVVEIVTTCSSSSDFTTTTASCHASFPHDVPARTTQHNNRFGMEADKRWL